MSSTIHFEVDFSRSDIVLIVKGLRKLYSTLIDFSFEDLDQDWLSVATQVTELIKLFEDEIIDHDRPVPKLSDEEIAEFLKNWKPLPDPFKFRSCQGGE